jgi:hypothetical protein
MGVDVMTLNRVVQDDLAHSEKVGTLLKLSGL